MASQNEFSLKHNNSSSLHNLNNYSFSSEQINSCSSFESNICKQLFITPFIETSDNAAFKNESSDIENSKFKNFSEYNSSLLKSFPFSDLDMKFSSDFQSNSKLCILDIIPSMKNMSLIDEVKYKDWFNHSTVTHTSTIPTCQLLTNCTSRPIIIPSKNNFQNKNTEIHSSILSHSYIKQMNLYKLPIDRGKENTAISINNNFNADSNNLIDDKAYLSSSILPNRSTNTYMNIIVNSNDNIHDQCNEKNNKVNISVTKNHSDNSNNIYIGSSTVPQHLNSVPQHLNSVPQHLNSVPQHLNSVPQHLNSVPQHLNSVPQHLNSVPQHLNSFIKRNNIHKKCVAPPPSPVYSNVNFIYDKKDKAHLFSGTFQLQNLQDFSLDNSIYDQLNENSQTIFNDEIWDVLPLLFNYSTQCFEVKISKDLYSIVKVKRFSVLKNSYHFAFKFARRYRLLLINHSLTYKTPSISQHLLSSSFPSFRLCNKLCKETCNGNCEKSDVYSDAGEEWEEEFLNNNNLSFSNSTDSSNISTICPSFFASQFLINRCSYILKKIAFKELWSSLKQEQQIQPQLPWHPSIIFMAQPGSSVIKANERAADYGKNFFYNYSFPPYLQNFTKVSSPSTFYSENNIRPNSPYHSSSSSSSTKDTTVLKNREKHNRLSNNISLSPRPLRNSSYNFRDEKGRYTSTSLGLIIPSSQDTKITQKEYLSTFDCYDDEFEGWTGSYEAFQILLSSNNPQNQLPQTSYKKGNIPEEFSFNKRLTRTTSSTYGLFSQYRSPLNISYRPNNSPKNSEPVSANFVLRQIDCNEEPSIRFAAIQYIGFIDATKHASIEQNKFDFTITFDSTDSRDLAEKEMKEKPPLIDNSLLNEDPITRRKLKLLFNHYIEPRFDVKGSNMKTPLITLSTFPYFYVKISMTSNIEDRYKIFLEFLLFQQDPTYTPSWYNNELIEVTDYIQRIYSILCESHNPVNIPDSSIFQKLNREALSCHNNDSEKDLPDGVSFDKSNTAWRSFWKQGYQNHSKGFSSRRYGYIQAKLLAVESRLISELNFLQHPSKGRRSSAIECLLSGSLQSPRSLQGFEECILGKKVSSGRDSNFYLSISSPLSLKVGFNGKFVSNLHQEKIIPQKLNSIRDNNSKKFKISRFFSNDGEFCNSDGDNSNSKNACKDSHSTSCTSHPNSLNCEDLNDETQDSSVKQQNCSENSSLLDESVLKSDNSTVQNSSNFDLCEDLSCSKKFSSASQNNILEITTNMENDSLDNNIFKNNSNSSTSTDLYQIPTHFQTLISNSEETINSVSNNSFCLQNEAVNKDIKFQAEYSNTIKINNSNTDSRQTFFRKRFGKKRKTHFLQKSKTLQPTLSQNRLAKHLKILKSPSILTDSTICLRGREIKREAKKFIINQENYSSLTPNTNFLSDISTNLSTELSTQTLPQMNSTSSQLIQSETLENVKQKIDKCNIILNTDDLQDLNNKSDKNITDPCSNSYKSNTSITKFESLVTQECLKNSFSFLNKQSNSLEKQENFNFSTDMEFILTSILSNNKNSIINKQPLLLFMKCLQWQHNFHRWCIIIDPNQRSTWPLNLIGNKKYFIASDSNLKGRKAAFEEALLWMNNLLNSRSSHFNSTKSKVDSNLSEISVANITSETSSYIVTRSFYRAPILKNQSNIEDEKNFSGIQNFSNESNPKLDQTTNLPIQSTQDQNEASTRLNKRRFIEIPTSTVKSVEFIKDEKLDEYFSKTSNISIYENSTKQKAIKKIEKFNDPSEIFNSQFTESKRTSKGTNVEFCSQTIKTSIDSNIITSHDNHTNYQKKKKENSKSTDIIKDILPKNKLTKNSFINAKSNLANTIESKPKTKLHWKRRLKVLKLSSTSSGLNSNYKTKRKHKKRL